MQRILHPLLAALAVTLTFKAMAGYVPGTIQYQGRLIDGAGLYSGVASMEFRVFHSATGGTPFFSETQTVTVVDGLYTVPLGAYNTASGGLMRAMQLATNQPWLEISVNAQTLDPREPVAAVAFAFHSASSWNLDGNRGTTAGNHFVGTVDNVPLEFRVENQRALTIYPRPVSPNMVAGHANNTVYTGSFGSVISGGGFFFSPNVVSGNYAFIGAGFSNRVTGYGSALVGGLRNEVRAEHGFIGGGTSNVIAEGGGTIAGGVKNRALKRRATIGGGENNVVTGEFSVIGGGIDNSITRDYAVIAGGEQGTVGADYAFIGGGQLNVVTGGAAAVLGGLQNIAGGFNSAVAGGTFNEARGNGSSVLGGNGNLAEGDASVVAGGYNNQAGGSRAMAAGGEGNSAAGSHSFAAGFGALALHQGAFVWADVSGTNISSTTSNQWTVRSSGGALFYSTPDSSAGVELVPGSSGWSATSDRHLKENITPVDPVEILRQLVDVPVSRWNFKGQGGASSPSQIGPMAQDFHDAFGLGGPETVINSVNADGVSMAAIQGLYKLVRELEQENAHIRARLQELEKAAH